MDQTCMIISSLGSDATILFASDSISDVLGYRPQEVHGKSAFDYFHESEVNQAKKIFDREVRADKAAVLRYVNLASRAGDWVCCECCFTVVHDVLVTCVSIYRHDHKSQRRAAEAPQVRRLFSSSSRDPRYHMLQHLSPKFKTPPVDKEPRMAMILNRFTRTLTVMFSTNAAATILGLSPAELQNKSFYECIEPNCLPDAIRCIESAKANDSIAYLRFWFRDPRRDEDFGNRNHLEVPRAASNAPSSTSDDSDGGAPVNDLTDVDMMMASNRPYQGSDNNDNNDFVAGRTSGARESPRRRPLPPIEVEAVISCTSDGLVVILRKARLPIPAIQPHAAHTPIPNGFFAAPWGAQPIQSSFAPHTHQHHFQAPLASHHMPFPPHIAAAGGPPVDYFMQSIRDVAVFAWALVGINRNMASYSLGAPTGQAQPLNFSAHMDQEDHTSGTQTNTYDTGSWSSESPYDPGFPSWQGRSDVSSMTSQQASAMCSYDVSPHVSDESSTAASNRNNYFTSDTASIPRPWGLSGSSSYHHDEHSSQRPWSEWSHQSTSSNATIRYSGNHNPPHWQVSQDGNNTSQPPAQPQTSAEWRPAYDPARNL